MLSDTYAEDRTVLSALQARRIGLVIARSLVWLPARTLPGNNPGQVVHTCVSVTKRYNLVSA